MERGSSRWSKLEWGLKWGLFLSARKTNQRTREIDPSTFEILSERTASFFSSFSFLFILRPGQQQSGCVGNLPACDPLSLYTVSCHHQCLESFGGEASRPVRSLTRSHTLKNKKETPRRRQHHLLSHARYRLGLVRPGLADRL